MAERPACYTCFYWVRGRGSQNLGACHRYPPEIHVTPAGYRTFFPLVDSGEWCGEHATPEAAAPAE